MNGQHENCLVKLDLGRWPDAIVVLMIRYVIVAAVIGLNAIPILSSVGFFAASAMLLALIAVPYALWITRMPQSARMVLLQFALDNLFLAVLILLTGGVESRYWLLFPFVIFSSLLNPRKVWVSSMAGVMLLVYLASAILYKVSLASVLGHTVQVRSWASFCALALPAILFIPIFSGLAYYLSRLCRLKEPGIDQVMVGQQIMKKMKVGMMILDEDDMIVQLNPQACAILETDERNVIGKNFKSFETSFTEIGTDPGTRRITRYMMRANGKEFPAMYERSRLDLPAPLNQELAKMGICNPKVVVFNDISSALAVRSETFKAEHVEIVDNLLNLIADGIRNPVTGITSAIQVMGKMEASENPKIRQAYNDQRKEIFASMLRDASRLDILIEYIVMHPQLSHNKFSELMEKLRSLPMSDSGDSKLSIELD